MGPAQVAGPDPLCLTRQADCGGRPGRRRLPAGRTGFRHARAADRAALAGTRPSGGLLADIARDAGGAGPRQPGGQGDGGRHGFTRQHLPLLRRGPHGSGGSPPPRPGRHRDRGRPGHWDSRSAAAGHRGMGARERSAESCPVRRPSAPRGFPSGGSGTGTGRGGGDIPLPEPDGQRLPRGLAAAGRGADNGQRRAHDCPRPTHGVGRHRRDADRAAAAGATAGRLPMG